MSSTTVHGLTWSMTITMPNH